MNSYIYFLWFDYSSVGRYNRPCFELGIDIPVDAKIYKKFQEVGVEIYLDIALIITSIALIASVILQSKGAGLGGLMGGDTGGVFTARRGIEKVLFRVTIGLGLLFFILAILTV